MYLYFKVIFLEEADKWHSLLGINKRRFEKHLSPVCEKEQSVFLGLLVLAGFALHLAQQWGSGLAVHPHLPLLAGSLPRGWEMSALVL